MLKNAERFQAERRDILRQLRDIMEANSLFQMIDSEPPRGARQTSVSARLTWLLFALIFVAIYFSSLFTPPLLDDVDAGHAQIAQHYIESGDWITAQTNGIRYLEKPPLPWWLVAISYSLFDQSAFSTHLPNALAMLALAVLAWHWTRRAWGPLAALYAGLGVLTSVGPFLFTRFIIPEAILSLLILSALYAVFLALEDHRPSYLYWTWTALALATLCKGLIGPVFVTGTLILYLGITGQFHRWRELKLFTGPLLYLLIAAPWHILVGLANPDQGNPVGNHPTVGNVHGFFYMYFINEHVLRFLNQRYPHDYNKLPFAVYWPVQLAWMFPWSLFIPALFATAWKLRDCWLSHLQGNRPSSFAARSAWMLTLPAGVILVFFSISTNLEYYTFPAWIPLFMLTGAAVAHIETGFLSTKWLTRAHLAFAILGVLFAATLGWGLWESRDLPYVADIGTLLAHRALAGYTLAMSHLFDLTTTAFAALRLPAGLAAVTLLIGPATGYVLRRQQKHTAATVSLGVTLSVFLIAAHIALARFEPMLSSKQLADTIIDKGSPRDSFIILGEQSDASSVIFYTHKFLNKPAYLAHPRCGQNGEGTTLLWGSCYPDAPDIFLDPERLSSIWGRGERKWLFAQDANRDTAEAILGDRLIPVQTIADKTLWTDRPFEHPLVGHVR